MGFLDELKRLAHPYENTEDDDYEDDYEEEDYQEPKRERERDRGRGRESGSYAEPERRNNKVVNIHTTTQLQVVLVKPERFDNAPEVADHLKYKRTVVLNLEGTSGDVARRLLDFLSGVAYANEGQMKKVAADTYIITPYNVNIQGDLLDELENSGFYL